MNPIVINYPSWHDDARRDRAAGLTVEKIADKYGLSRTRMSHIVTPNWKAYLAMWRERVTNKTPATVANGNKVVHEGKYVFVSVHERPPSEVEALRKEERKNMRKPMEDIVVAKEREFETVKEFQEGKALVGGKIVCYKCGASETYFNYRGAITPSYLPKEFQRRGWLVGKNKSTDMCPSCLAKLRGAKPKSDGASLSPAPAMKDLKASTSPAPAISKGIQDMTAKPSGIELISKEKKETAMQAVQIKEPAKDLPPVPVPERKMTRSDDQIIFLKLTDVYVDENSGYKDDWDDMKVAQDLNVPVDWVALVRDRSFGPETNALRQKKAMDDLIALGEKIERQVLLADKKMETLQMLDHKVSEITAQINSQIERFEQLMKSLETEDKHVENIVKDFDASVKEFKEMFASVKPKALTS